jgi:hypothetical protein
VFLRCDARRGWIPASKLTDLWHTWRGHGPTNPELKASAWADKRILQAMACRWIARAKARGSACCESITGRSAGVTRFNNRL